MIESAVPLLLTRIAKARDVRLNCLAELPRDADAHIGLTSTGLEVVRIGDHVSVIFRLI